MKSATPTRTLTRSRKQSFFGRPAIFAAVITLVVAVAVALSAYRPHTFCRNRVYRTRARTSRSNCTLINDVTIDPAIRSQLLAHDPETDRKYTKRPKHISSRSAQAAPYFSSGFPVLGVDYAIAPSPGKGLGVFALRNFTEGEALGVYAGHITANETGTAYAWNYPTELPGIGSLSVDGRDTGNAMRFVNDFGTEMSVKISFVLHEYDEAMLGEPCDRSRNKYTVDFAQSGRSVPRIWYVVYFLQRNVEMGEEFSVSYGDKYWSNTRKGLRA